MAASSRVQPVHADAGFERATPTISVSSGVPLISSSLRKGRGQLLRRRGGASDGAFDGDDQTTPAGAGANEGFLDPTDAGIEEAIQRLERKSFVQDGLIPEVQKLLALPAADAKQAYVAALTQYTLVMMLVLASLLGSALNPLPLEDFPEDSRGLVAAYNMLSTIICCATLCGSATFVLETTIIEGTPEDRIHSIIAQADGICAYGVAMLAVSLHPTVALLLLRAWISGFDPVHSVLLSAICVCIWLAMMVLYFRHLQRNWGVEAQLWTKLFTPPLWQREKCSAAIDELVAELRYLQQPRDKMLTPAQLGACLNRYFRSLRAQQAAGGIGGAGGACCQGLPGDEPCMQHAAEERGSEGQQEPPPCDIIQSAEVLMLADQAAFLAQVEAEAGGRLAPAAQRLAKRAFDKIVEAALEKFADEAVMGF